MSETKVVYKNGLAVRLKTDGKVIEPEKIPGPIPSWKMISHIEKNGRRVR